MKARSLRLRLLAGAMVAIFAALAVAWLAMTMLFERHIERRVAEDLTRDGLQLVAALSVEADGKPALDASPTDPRFDNPTSGLYWQVSTKAGSLRSRSLWDQTLPASPLAEARDWRARRLAGPFSQRLFVVERLVRPDRSGPPVLVQVAANAAAVAAARSEFGRELALFLLLLWAVLSAAAWAQVSLGLAPLAAIRRELDGLKRNAAERLSGAHPSEIEPLVEAINALAEARERDLTRARRRAGDLAHGLKTPLAALSALSRRARDQGAADAAEGLDRAIAAVSGVVEAELARARVASLGPAQSPVREALERLVSVIAHTEAGAQLVFEVEAANALTAPLAVEDLIEMMGALTENAARHARRRVRLSAVRGPEGLTLQLDDDGPGIADSRLADVIARGARLDEAEAGQGLGLAIARDLAEASGGTLTLSASDLGGLRAAVTWREP